MKKVNLFILIIIIIFCFTGCSRLGNCAKMVREEHLVKIYMKNHFLPEHFKNDNYKINSIQQLTTQSDSNEIVTHYTKVITTINNEEIIFYVDSDTFDVYYNNIE